EIGEDLRAYADVALRLALVGSRGRGRRFALMRFAMKDQSLFRAHAEALRRLVQIDQRARPFTRNYLQRAIEDYVALAKRPAEDVAGQAVRVHADQDRVGCALHVALDQGDVGLAIQLAFECDHAEVAMARG